MFLGLLIAFLLGLASQLYPQGAAHIIGKATKVDLIGDNIKILFYSGAFNGAHEFVSDLTGASIIARSGNLAGKTSTGGVFDANDLTVTAVSGAAFTHVILYKDTGADGTSPLIAIFDVSTFTPNGGDVNVVFNASGLFSIA
jgi:hypothetical protein